MPEQAFDKALKALQDMDPDLRDLAVDLIIDVANGDKDRAVLRAERAAILAAAKKAIG
jgi:hypothetical protein